jgi:predicted nucleotidyltransferase component of viral defense system
MRLVLGQSGTKIDAYSIHEMVAEKLRAFLQQEMRNRPRRQDIYDLAHLVRRFALDPEERGTVLDILRKKCAIRMIDPSIESIDDPKLIARAKSEWDSMRLETGDLPEFDACHAVVRAFYRSLPW